MVIGGLLALIHAFLTTTMRANQVVSGLSITLFGTGFSSFLGQRLGPESNNFRLVGLRAERILPFAPKWAKDIPDSFGIFESRHNYLSRIPPYSPSMVFSLYKTRPGLWLVPSEKIPIRPIMESMLQKLDISILLLVEC